MQFLSILATDTSKNSPLWNQLTTLLYAQASGKNSLRDIQTAIGTQEPKLYHLGLPAVIGQQEIDLKKGLPFDKTIQLSGILTQEKYTQSLRLIGFYDSQTNLTYHFLTNNFSLSAWTITQIYKARWQVELFFKWIKQHFKIKTFLGTSKNAVMTQVWVAMSYFLLLAYIKFHTRFQKSLFLLHRLIQNTLLDRLSLVDLLRLPEKKLPKLKNMGPQLCFLF